MIQDERKTKEELLEELKALRRDLEQFEQAEDIKNNLSTKDSEQIFRTIFENAADGILLTDVENKKFFMGNNIICQLLGINKTEIDDLGVTDIHPEQDLPYVVEQFDKQARGEITLAKDIPVKRKNGSVLFADVNAFPIKLDGKTYLMGIFRDVSERKRAEEKWRSLVQTAPSFIMTVNSDGVIQFLNRPTGGLTIEQAIGTTVYEHVEPGQCDIMRKSIEKVFKTGEPGSYEILGLGPNGPNSAWYETHLGPVIRDGGVVAVTMICTDITERKKAEEALQESELRYHTLFEILPVGVGLSTLDGQIVDANSTFQQMIGYSNEEMSQINSLDTYYNPAERASLLEQIQQDGLVRNFEVQLKHKDDSKFLASLNVTAMKTRDETVLVTVAEDITEQKQMKKTLAENEQKYRTLVESTRDPIATFDDRGVIMFANTEAAESLGYQPEDLTGKTMWDIFPKEIADRQVTDVRQVIETGQRINTVTLSYIKGKPRWYNTIIEPLKDEHGRTTAAMIVARDIDDIKRAQEQIQKLSYAVESSINGIAIGDAEGNLTYVNPALLEMWGYDNENEVVGRNASEFWQTKDQGQKILETVINKGSWIGEMTALKKDGSTIDVQVCATLVTDENDKPISMMVSFVNISETKRREEELSRYRGQMAHAEQLASLGTLSATIAHQLTQPLTVIRLSIDNALDELGASSSSDTVIRRLKESVTQVSNITSIIENFRNFARKSSGRTVAEVNLKVVAVRISRLLSESARSANVILRIRNMDDLPCPWMNENELEQLFFALIENAIQAADGKKTRQLVISGAVKDKHIELRISDDCGGIAPENIDKIFEPFFTTKPRGQGTGLGLCIVKDVVSHNGGRVRVDSEFGKGTTFTIDLPVEKNNIMSK